jgi:hypothetical protein
MSISFKKENTLNRKSETDSLFHPFIPNKKQKITYQIPYQDIATEVWTRIFLYLGPKDLCAVALTCRLFSEISKDDLLWKDLYRTAFKSFSLVNATSSFKENYALERKIADQFKCSEPAFKRKFITLSSNDLLAPVLFEKCLAAFDSEFILLRFFDEDLQGERQIGFPHFQNAENEFIERLFRISPSHFATLSSKNTSTEKMIILKSWDISKCECINTLEITDSTKADFLNGDRPELLYVFKNSKLSIFNVLDGSLVYSADFPESWDPETFSFFEVNDEELVIWASHLDAIIVLAHNNYSTELQLKVPTSEGLKMIAAEDIETDNSNYIYKRFKDEIFIFNLSDYTLSIYEKDGQTLKSSYLLKTNELREQGSSHAHATFHILNSLKFCCSLPHSLHWFDLKDGELIHTCYEIEKPMQILSFVVVRDDLIISEARDNNHKHFYQLHDIRTGKILKKITPNCSYIFQLNNLIGYSPYEGFGVPSNSFHLIKYDLKQSKIALL